MKVATAVPCLLRLTMFVAAVLLALVAASGVRAQTWTESGDAGDTVPIAQTTVGTGPLTAIDGTLASSTDVDLYCIRLTAVPPAGLPLVQLQCVVMNGPNVCLFDAAGNGVFTNSTCSGGNKTIVAPNVSLAPGVYFVGVSYTGMDPQSATGAIWNTSVSGQHAPDGPGAPGPLTGWSGTPVVQPLNPYHISLNFMGYCDASTPAAHPTWGSLKIRYGR